MSRNLTYNQWIPYIHYEKHECDIKLKDGRIIYHVYPNAGNFYLCCGGEMKWKEIDVVEIMYRKYYSDDLCKGECNEKI